MIKELSLIAAVAAGGWGAHEYLETRYAGRDDVAMLSQQTAYVIERQMAALVSEIAWLEKKGDLTPTELARLQYLREQLQELRRLRNKR